MQSTNWPVEHCEALRQGLASGMSFSKVADAINARFRTDYSRSAAIGRARRMGLISPARSNKRPKHLPGRPPKAKAKAKAPRRHKPRHVPEFLKPAPDFK